jgi:DNA-binding MarR family transcriptional regulator
MPIDTDSFPIVMRALGIVANRDVQREYIERIVKRAGVELSPAAAWLLLKIEGDPHTDAELLARAHGLEPGLLAAGLSELEDKRLVEEEPSSDGAKETHSLTSEGCDVFDRIGVARRLHLTEVFSEWPAEKHDEVERAMERLRGDLVPKAHRPDSSSHGVGLRRQTVTD